MLLILLILICLAGNIALLVFAFKARTIENWILSLVLPGVFYILLLLFFIPMGAFLMAGGDEILFMVYLIAVFMAHIICLGSTAILSVRALVKGIRMKNKLLIIFSLLPVYIGLYFVVTFDYALVPILVYGLIFLSIMVRKVVRKLKGRGMKEVEINEE